MPRKKKAEAAAAEAVTAEVKTENAAAEISQEAPKKRRTRAKKEVVPTVIIESVLGGQIRVEEIQARVKAAIGKTEADHIEIYVKAEENRAYFIAGDVSGSVFLW